MKVSFITGGASGIGKATIKKFIENDVAVGFLDLDEFNSKKLVQQYPKNNILFSEGDVTNVSDIKRALANTSGYFGKIDIVFANAGVHSSNSIFDITESEFSKIIDINLKSAIFAVKEGLPYLQENGGGKIILMGSDQCFIGKKNNLAYGASKGAIAQVTKSLALEVSKFNISVNTVCPGTIDTPMTQNALERWAKRDFNGNVKDAFNKEESEFPIGRMGVPEEIAELVYFLATKSTIFTTGSLFKIDGGITAG